MSTASYLVAERLSENLARTPEGFLLARSVVVGRTGWQRYRGLELGLSDAPNETVDVWRDESEVFAKATLASGEAKPVTVLHPGEFVTPDTVSAIKGTMVNLRRGKKLADGSGTGLLADVILWDPIAIADVLSGRLRSTSLGYRCVYQPMADGRGLAQTQLVINHLALLPEGSARGGSEVRIQDSKGGAMDFKEIDAKLDKMIRICEDALNKPTLTTTVQRIQRDADTTSRLAASGIGPFQFSEELAKANKSYADYSAKSAAGADFAQQAKEAGLAMQERFRPKQCQSRTAPVRPHAQADAAEDFTAAAARVGRAMRGR